MTQIAICTVFEGDYHHGVAALCNSLHASGFRGNCWAGYRGALPKWLPQTGICLDGLSVKPVLMEPGGWHLAHEKPALMSRVMRELDPTVDGVAYFDPDIVCVAPWTFFRDWIAFGVALCEDGAYTRMDRSHPIRLGWIKMLGDAGMSVGRLVDYYINSGFVGVSRSNSAFVDTWQNVLMAMSHSGVDLNKFKPGVRTDLWFGTDQDALNAAVMVSDCPVSIVSPDGMGFRPAGYIMHHVTDQPKPWQTKYLRRLLWTGTRPSLGHKSFWRHVNKVFHTMPSRTAGAKRVSLQLAIGLSRFYRS